MTIGELKRKLAPVDDDALVLVEDFTYGIVSKNDRDVAVVYVVPPDHSGCVDKFFDQPADGRVKAAIV
jgi:hypothetical protein